MRIAIIGSGGREHALAWCLSRERRAEEVFVLPGNAGTPNAVPIPVSDLEGIEAFARERAIDLVVVGPEGPLAAGLVDHLRARGIGALGPTRDAARLETSKTHAKEFMSRNGVATGDFLCGGGGDRIDAALERFGERVVVKYDGLAQGKGVWVCDSGRAAAEALDTLRLRHGPDARFLVEERLEGDELSLIVLTDGRTVRAFPLAQDHKQLLDGDRGPNTGGMGAHAPVPQVTTGLRRELERRIVEPTLAGLEREGLAFRGFLYFGIMVTPDGPRLLEYNVRLGDPEAQVILPLLDTDLATAAVLCARGSLGEAPWQVSPWSAVGVVLAAPGYPDAPRSGQPISGLDAGDEDILVFHSGTRRQGPRVVTHGGRVLTVVARDAAPERAIEHCYAACARIHFDGVQYRRDIGRRAWRCVPSGSPS